jgi:integrase
VTTEGPSLTPALLKEFQEFLEAKQRAKTNEAPAPSQTNKKDKSSHYLEREELDVENLIIFIHSQKKNRNWYMRFYLGGGRYKVECLNTTDKTAAKKEAIERWRKLQNQIDAGGRVVQKDVNKCLDEYLRILQDQVESGLIRPNTLAGKSSSLKKLRLFLEPFKYPKDIPPTHFKGYVKWRRTVGYSRYHKNNPEPPTAATINKELSDYNRFFNDYLIEKGYYLKKIKFPFIEIKRGYFDDKNIPFDEKDWMKLVYHLRTWTRSPNNPRRGTFYRYVVGEFLKILANSGLRPHEALLLKWEDITIKEREQQQYRNFQDARNSGKTRKEMIVEIKVSHNTKTGRRLVISPAGVYFRRIRDHYRKHGHTCGKSEYIFRNIGQSNQDNGKNTGKPLSMSGIRHLWYELISELNFDNHYTIYSCRSFYINQRLELGVPPHIVAKLVGHSVETMEKHYEDISIRKLTEDVVKVRREKLRENDFLTFDMDLDF